MSQKSYTQEELLKIQSLELKALSVLIEICEKLSIDYFLVGGSCLGAVRHNGFIPWDDDIDVGMTREDYLRFLAQAPEHLPKGYTLQTPYNCKQNPYFYTKLRIDGTKFVEYRNRRVKMHHGIYIDIFPYDEVPDDEKRNLREYLRYRRLIQLAVFRQCPGPYKKPDNAVRMCKAIVARCIMSFISSHIARLCASSTNLRPKIMAPISRLMPVCSPPCGKRDRYAKRIYIPCSITSLKSSRSKSPGIGMHI